MKPSPSQMSRSAFKLLIVLAIAIPTPIFGGCSRSPSTSNGSDVQEPTPGTTSAIEAEKLALVRRVRPQVETFCGNCHAMPRPASSAREDWVEEVNQGYVLYGESGRDDLEIPAYDDVLKFFQYQALEELTLHESIRNDPRCPISFEIEGVRFPGSRPPGVTNVQWLDIGLNDSSALVYCDIGSGAVMAHWPEIDGGKTTRLATLLQPVHVESCDLDSDGSTDLMVADIGEFDANDTNFGRVVWLRRLSDSKRFESITLMEDVARVSDVRPGDFDGDGDLDLMVAIFGWRKTGRIVMLVNEGPDPSGTLQFLQRDVDPRHGASHVIPVDFDQDGSLDFITLISQEHEVIELFHNDGRGGFSNRVIWAAPDPAYGSSGIELVDLDQDGDLDLLYTNGDSFDRGPKPHHSVQWLENPGELPFVHHHLCFMPGVLTAKAEDFDGDGDLDIVAASLLPGPVAEQPRGSQISSTIMLVQDEQGRFAPTQLEQGQHQHLSIAKGDFDRDGRPDFAVGNYVRGSTGDDPDLILWWNR